MLFYDIDDEGTPDVIDGTGLAEALLGLDGFKVLSVTEGEHELVIAVETTAAVTGCWDCGVQAECHDRVRVDIRDLACFGPDFDGSGSLLEGRDALTSTVR